MNSNLKNKTESIQLSIYCNLICQILKLHRNLSICKVVTFAYIIKQYRFLGGNIYTARNTQDIIYKGISLLAGDFDNFCNSVPFILKALHLLICKGLVVSENDILTLTNENLNLDSVYRENNFIKKVIEKSKTMTDRQFVKEVIYNV